MHPPPELLGVGDYCRPGASSKNTLPDNREVKRKAYHNLIKKKAKATNNDKRELKVEELP